MSDNNVISIICYILYFVAIIFYEIHFRCVLALAQFIIHNQSVLIIDVAVTEPGIGV